MGNKKRKSDTSAEDDLFEQELAQDLAKKINFLFDKLVNPQTGQKCTFRDVEIATQGKLNYQWLWRVAHAQIINPNLYYLRLLTNFFKVSPSLWFNEFDEAMQDKLIREHQLFLEGKTTDNPGLTLALMSSDLDTADKELFTSIWQLVKSKKSSEPK